MIFRGVARRKLFEIFELLAARASEYPKLKFPVIPILKGFGGVSLIPNRYHRVPGDVGRSLDDYCF